MFRTLLVVALAGVAGVAQDKKDPPKKLVRIAVAEPTEAAKDQHFAIQGEYAGLVSERAGSKKLGAQVVARGTGTFDIKITYGGLPGDGWDGKAALKARGASGAAEDRIVVTSQEVEGMIQGGKLALKDLRHWVTIPWFGEAVLQKGQLILTDGMRIDTTLAKVERKSPTLGAEPPKGATVLWSKEGDETKWKGGRLMTLSDGRFLTPAKIDGKGGDIKTKEKFGAIKVNGVLALPWLTPHVFSVNVPQAFKAHVEFRLPWMPNSTGQGRGNSGVYLQDRYELQVLDSFGLSGENNECGGIYTQHKPSVNMCLPPMVWQTYDIEFTPAEFDKDGKKTKNGRATILHNGVKIHDNVEFPKDCPGGQKETAEPGPFRFQDHGDPVIYRNVWVLPVK